MCCAAHKLKLILNMTQWRYSRNHLKYVFNPFKLRSRVVGCSKLVEFFFFFFQPNAAFHRDKNENIRVVGQIKKPENFTLTAKMREVLCEKLKSNFSFLSLSNLHHLSPDYHEKLAQVLAENFH
jgi:hypothetical protein